MYAATHLAIASSNFHFNNTNFPTLVLSFGSDATFGFMILHQQSVVGPKCALFNQLEERYELSYFQMQQIPMATLGEKLDHIVD